MNNEVNKPNGSFLNGFLVGALVGAAVVFFLGTKKGKRILKMISEKGLDNVSTMFDKAGNAAELEEGFEEGEESPLEPSAASEEAVGKPIRQEKKPVYRVKRVSKDSLKTKRFFRGISRHVN
jgi:gas vesicle protein